MSINKINPAAQSPVTYTPYKNTVNNRNESKHNTDTFTLTRDGQEYLAQKNNTSANNKENTSSVLAQLEAFRKQMEESDEKSGDSITDISKCMKIARRIMNGDKVPLKDMKFLAEKQPEIYKNALMFKRQNPEPKKYKSCLDKEDEESNNNSVSSAQTAESNDSFLANVLDELGE